MRVERHRGLIRFALLYMAVAIGWLAVWIMFAPKGFYNGFPGAGVHWVSALPPYNEHLERDFGAFALGLTVLTVLTAIWMERRLVQATALSLLAAGVPHLAYHLTTTGHYSTADNVASIAGLGLYVVFPLALLYLVSEGAQRAAPVAAAPPPSEARPA